MSGSIRHGFPTPLKIPYATIPDRSLLRARKPKLTAHQQREALRRRDAGEPTREIARTYNVSHSTISRLTA
jgi:DNA invertase Pin-like site-specific DNA recombinase